jgi:Zn-dependent M16 (insulinase) family peptidase
VSKSQHDIPAAKRDGYDMTTDVMYCVQLDEGKSAKRASMTITQEPFLENLEKDLESDDETVVKNFQALRAECYLK